MPLRSVHWEKSPAFAAGVRVVTEAVYFPVTGSIVISTPPASPTAATSNVPAEGRMSKPTVKAPVCCTMEKESPDGPQGPGSSGPLHAFRMPPGGNPGSFDGYNP